MAQATPHEVSVPVRWSDFDRYGHRMNANYIEIAQEARLAFARDVIYPEIPDFDVFVRHIDADFQRPVDPRKNSALTVRSAVSKLGNTSLTTRQDILDADGETACVIYTVQVMVDMQAQRPRPLSDAEREILSQLVVDEH